MTEPRTYRAGDTIRLELDVEDPSGVALVQVYFAHAENPNAHIRMDKSLENNPQTETIVLEHPVTENTTPGEYRCTWIYREDAVGNGSTDNSRQNLAFRVEDTSGDHEAPEITDVRLS